MERLTTRYDGHAVMAWEYEEKYTASEWIDMLTDRLAAYEDTGLEPEEIIKLKSIKCTGKHDRCIGWQWRGPQKEGD